MLGAKSAKRGSKLKNRTPRERPPSTMGGRFDAENYWDFVGKGAASMATIEATLPTLSNGHNGHVDEIEAVELTGAQIVCKALEEEGKLNAFSGCEPGCSR